MTQSVDTSVSKDNPLISHLDVGTIKSKKGMTMGKTNCTGAVADKDTLELIVHRNVKSSNAVWIGLVNTRGILRHCFIRVFVGTVNCLERKFFCTKGFGICYFNAEFTLYVEDNVGGPVSRLLLDCRKNPLTEVPGSCLVMAGVSNSRTPVLPPIFLDAKDVASATNRGSINPPTTIFTFAAHFPTRFGCPECFELKYLLNSPRLDRVFEQFQGRMILALRKGTSIDFFKCFEIY